MAKTLSVFLRGINKHMWPGSIEDRVRAVGCSWMLGSGFPAIRGTSFLLPWGHEEAVKDIRA